MTIALPTVASVRLIITTSASDEQVQLAIDDAALIVEDCVADLPAARQEAIIRYVAAHILSVSPLATGGSGVVTSASLGDASESYGTAPLGEGLLGSAYGKAAIALDPNGCLIGLGKVTAKWEVL